MSSLYEILMLPTLPNYLSCHSHRCFNGLHNAVWIHLLQMYCPIVFFFSINLLQMHTCLCIDNRCVDKRKRYAFHKMTTHSPHSQNNLIRQLYQLGSGFGKFKKYSNHMILYIRVRKSYLNT